MSAFWRCRRCGGPTEKYGEALNGATATFQCTRSGCRHVFVKPNIRKTYVGGGGTDRILRDFSPAIRKTDAIQERMEQTYGVDNAQAILKNRKPLLENIFKQHGIRSWSDFLDLVRSTQRKDK